MVTVKSVYANREKSNAIEQFKGRLERELNSLIDDGYNFENIRVDINYWFEQYHTFIIAYKAN